MVVGWTRLLQTSMYNAFETGYPDCEAWAYLVKNHGPVDDVPSKIVDDRGMTIQYIVHCLLIMSALSGDFCSHRS